MRASRKTWDGIRIIDWYFNEPLKCRVYLVFEKLFVVEMKWTDFTFNETGLENNIIIVAKL